MTQLSPHFHLAEFTRSFTARRLGIDNTPPTEAVENLRALCLNVLEPLRSWIIKPISVLSGYRSPALNTAVHGRSDSQHMRGEAVDVEVAGITVPDLARWVIRGGIPFDQMCVEFWEPPAHDGWLHLSYTMRRPRRGEVLTIGRGGTVPGLPSG